MLGRSVWQLLALTALISAFLACSQQLPPAPKPADTPAGAARTTPETKAAAATAPPAQASPAPQTAVSPAASPAPASKAASPPPTSKAASPVPAAERVEPKGKATFAWHTALSPVWLDPQEYPAGTGTPFVFGFMLHDALVKPMPGNPYAPSLAESYEIGPDFKSATFKLREGIKFHNGDPVTRDDVKFTL